VVTQQNKFGLVETPLFTAQAMAVFGAVTRYDDAMLGISDVLHNAAEEAPKVPGSPKYRMLETRATKGSPGFAVIFSWEQDGNCCCLEGISLVQQVDAALTGANAKKVSAA
jgi:hypothetical protein